MNRNTALPLSKMEQAIHDRAHPPTKKNEGAASTRLGAAYLLRAGNSLLTATSSLTLSGEEAAAGRQRLLVELVQRELDVLRQYGTAYSDPSDRTSLSKENTAAQALDTEIARFADWKRASQQISAEMSAAQKAASGDDVMPSRRSGGPDVIARGNRQALAALSEAVASFSQAAAEFDQAKESRAASFCRVRGAALQEELVALQASLPVSAADVGWLADKKRGTLAANVDTLAKGK